MVLWKSVGEGKVVPLWHMYRLITKNIIAIGKPEGNAIPEIFSLLRTMQHTLHWAMPDNIDKEKVKPVT